MKKSKFRQNLKAALLCSVALTFVACASNAPKGPAVFHPLEKAKTEERIKAGYFLDKHSWAFENKAASFRITHVSEANGGAGFPLGDDLVQNGYVLFRMDIENRSQTAKILFNPAQSVLTDDALDYRKPLDYTDFYEMVSSSDDPESGKRLSEIKDRFYDLSVTIKPGAKTSKLLAFSPLTKGVASAELGIKEIYVGTASLRLSFPFVLRYEKKEAKESDASSQKPAAQRPEN